MGTTVKSKTEDFELEPKKTSEFGDPFKHQEKFGNLIQGRIVFQFRDQAEEMAEMDE